MVPVQTALLIVFIAQNLVRHCFVDHANMVLDYLIQVLIIFAIRVMITSVYNVALIRQVVNYVNKVILKYLLVVLPARIIVELVLVAGPPATAVSTAST